MNLIDLESLRGGQTEEEKMTQSAAADRCVELTLTKADEEMEKRSAESEEVSKEAGKGGVLKKALLSLFDI